MDACKPYLLFESSKKKITILPLKVHQWNENMDEIKIRAGSSK